MRDPCFTRLPVYLCKQQLPPSLQGGGWKSKLLSAIPLSPRAALTKETPRRSPPAQDSHPAPSSFDSGKRNLLEGCSRSREATHSLGWEVSLRQAVGEPKLISSGTPRAHTISRSHVPLSFLIFLGWALKGWRTSCPTASGSSAQPQKRLLSFGGETDFCFLGHHQFRGRRVGALGEEILAVPPC